VPVADNDGVAVAYEASGEGPPVVFVHGITEDLHSWDEVVPMLAGELRCVRLDLRGHGESGSASAYDSFSLASDVAAVIADARADRPVLVGHSLGAVAVSIHAAGAGASGVVNVDQGLRFGDFAAAIGALEDDLKSDGFHGAMSAISAQLGDDRVPERWRDYVRARKDRARQEVVLGIWAAVFQTPAAELDALGRQVLSTIEAPYLAIHGDEPPPGYAQWFADAAPNGTLEVWPGLGHWVHLVDPNRFVGRIRAFCHDAFGV
jgi:pimeloyl-ACP methyl ester carboxylesterase